MNDWWNDASVPAQQLAVVLPELAEIEAGNLIPPYRQAFACIDRAYKPGMSLLDVGAGMGHYCEALRLTGRPIWRHYTALDASEAFKAAAAERWPLMRYDIGQASNLPYPASSFSIVLSGACLMYAANPGRDIWEAARVSSEYVIFHRTALAPETVTLETEAYGGSVRETRFAEVDLLKMFETSGLSVVHVETIFLNPDGYAHKTYLLKKDAVFPVRV